MSIRFYKFQHQIYNKQQPRFRKPLIPLCSPTVFRIYPATLFGKTSHGD